jgi:hypothetical protein
MALTLETLKAEVTNAIGGEPASPHTSTVIVNRAGTHLHTMHEWRFNNREPWTLTMTANDPRVPLPPDLGRIISIYTNGSQFIQLTGIPELARQALNETVSSSSLSSFYGSVIYPGNEGTEPHIYVTPTPTSNDSDVAQLWYRAGWVPLVEDTDTAAVPAQVELLLVDLVREVAKGYDEDNLKQRLQAVSQSLLYKETRRWDGQLMPQGTLSGGHWQGRSTINTYVITDATAPS